MFKSILVLVNLSTRLVDSRTTVISFVDSKLYFSFRTRLVNSSQCSTLFLWLHQYELGMK